ncbi:hypothetical protein [Microvirga tunisiensis]|jgi:hypothetical protein|uniref:Uncharacterized protein n=1 Tax=Microvirga tunisiensis TaxID=2108360 RepID=A0A5N7MQW6_9HYPH|nr:hypothetical protein [Microvirga tunisiensis]MPR11342.1 hypothetical protein [Microvirga tunisiensis]MPR29401.1 hypothetical protein [Microvirga tunisiensis]
MGEQPYGFNKGDLQEAVSIGYAVSAVIIGAVTNRPDAAEEARRLCGTLEYGLRLRDVQDDTAAAVATNVYKYVIEALGTPG